MPKRTTIRANSGCAKAARLLGLATISAMLVYAMSINVFAQPPEKPLSLLTHAEQIRRLSPEQAALGYPVQVRGVITMDAPAPDFFVQDTTAGIYVEGSVEPNYTHLLGQQVELEGITGPGKFAPVIREQRLRVLGKGVLPGAQMVSFSEVADGQKDSQWVRMRGTGPSRLTVFPGGRLRWLCESPLRAVSSVSGYRLAGTRICLPGSTVRYRSRAYAGACTTRIGSSRESCSTSHAGAS